MTTPKSYPDNYDVVDLPSGYKPKAGTWALWKSIKGLLIRDDAGKDIVLEPASQVIDALYKESADPPNFDVADWRFWHQTTVQGTDRRSQLYYRVAGSNDAILLHDVTYPSS